MAFVGRAHGAATQYNGYPTGWPTYGRLASKVITGILFAAGNYIIWQNLTLAIIFGALSVLALSTGHGRFFGMKGANIADPNPEWVEKNIAAYVYKGDITKPLYSWICMGIKGLGIGLAIAPYGLLLAIAWPLSYAMSIKYFNDTAPAEYISFAFAGLALVSVIL